GDLHPRRRLGPGRSAEARVARLPPDELRPPLHGCEEDEDLARDRADAEPELHARRPYQVRGVALKNCLLPGDQYHSEPALCVAVRFPTCRFLGIVGPSARWETCGHRLPRQTPTDSVCAER